MRKLFGRKKAHPTSSSSAATPEPQQSHDLVKRRVRVQLAILDRPLMTDAEFLIDPRFALLTCLVRGASVSS